MIKILLYIYSVLLIVGGVFGYFKAKSIISLVAGIASGLLMLLALYWANSNPSLGYKVACGISGVLSIIFIKRFLKTKIFMPSGLLFVLSITAFLLTNVVLIKL